MRRVADYRSGAALACTDLHAAQLHAYAAVNIRTEYEARAQGRTPESEGQQASPNQYGDEGASHREGPIVHRALVCIRPANWTSASAKRCVAGLRSPAARASVMEPT